MPQEQWTLGELYTEVKPNLISYISRKYPRVKEPIELIHDALIKIDKEPPARPDRFIGYMKKRIDFTFHDQWKAEKAQKRDGEVVNMLDEPKHLWEQKMYSYPPLHTLYERIMSYPHAISTKETLFSEEIKDNDLTNCVYEQPFEPLNIRNFENSHDLIRLIRNEIDSRIDEEFSEPYPQQKPVTQYLDKDLTIVFEKRIFDLEGFSFWELKEELVKEARRYIPIRLGTPKRSEERFVELYLELYDYLSRLLMARNEREIFRWKIYLLYEHAGYTREEIARKEGITESEVDRMRGLAKKGFLSHFPKPKYETHKHALEKKLDNEIETWEG